MAATGNVRVRVIPDYKYLTEALRVLASALDEMATVAEKTVLFLETLEREQAEEVT